MATGSIIDGFAFADDADISLASSEIEKIKYIAGRMNMDNPKGVLAVYDKLITSGIFVTPVGYEYLRTLQNYLYKSKDIPDDAVREIPVPISYTRALNIRSEDRSFQVGGVIHLQKFDSLVAILLREQLHLILPVVGILLLQSALIVKSVLIAFIDILKVTPKLFVARPDTCQHTACNQQSSRPLFHCSTFFMAQRYEKKT